MIYGTSNPYHMNIKTSFSREYWYICNSVLLLTVQYHFSSNACISLVSMYNIFQIFLARNDEKLAVCKDRGANVCINYKMEDFVRRVKEEICGKCIFSNIKTSLFFNYKLVKLKNMIIILLSGHFHREVFFIVCYCQGS